MQPDDDDPWTPDDPRPPDDPGRRTDEVWHRALLPHPISDLPGDVAVHHALAFHGRVMNGGVLNAVEIDLESGDGAAVDTVESAYRWLGLDAVADLVVEVRRAVTQGDTRRHRAAARLESESNRVYDAAVPDDPALEAVLRRRVEESPASFSPGGIPRFDHAAWVQQQMRGPWA